MGPASCRNGGAGCTAALIRGHSDIRCDETFHQTGPLSTIDLLCLTNGGAFDIATLDGQAAPYEPCTENVCTLPEGTWTSASTCRNGGAGCTAETIRGQSVNCDTNFRPTGDLSTTNLVCIGNNGAFQVQQTVFPSHHRYLIDEVVTTPYDPREATPLSANPSPTPRPNIVSFDTTAVSFSDIHSYALQYMGIILGGIQSSAPTSTSSELVQHGTQLVVGSWLSGSFDLPRVTLAGHDYEIIDWGPRVGRAMLVIHDFSAATDIVGVVLEPPPDIQDPATQTLSVGRWDADGNRISTGPMTFRVHLGFGGEAPYFHRYDDGSTVGNDLVGEGGTVAPCDPPEDGCWEITSIKTSSIASFNASSRLSPSPSPGSPSPSPSPGSATTDDDALVYAWLGLLILPFCCGCGLLFWLWRKAKRRDQKSDAIPLAAPYPLFTTAPVASHPQLMVCTPTGSPQTPRMAPPVYTLVPCPTPSAAQI